MNKGLIQFLVIVTITLIGWTIKIAFAPPPTSKLSPEIWEKAREEGKVRVVMLVEAGPDVLAAIDKSPSVIMVTTLGRVIEGIVVGLFALVGVALLALMLILGGRADLTSRGV